MTSNHQVRPTVSCDVITFLIIVAATIADSPSFATRGSIASGNTGISLARLRWKMAIEHQIALVHIQKNSELLVLYIINGPWLNMCEN